MKEKKTVTPLVNQQATFLNLVMSGRLTTAEVMRELNLALYTVRRWMGQPHFVEQWENAIRFVERAYRSDVASGRIAAGTREEVTDSTGQSGADAACSAAPSGRGGCPPPSGGELGGEVEPSIQPLSERERIRSLHGREAAEAFDRLVQLRLKNQAAAAAARAVTTEVDPPDGNASVVTTDHSPPSPAPAETTVAVPEVDVQSCAIA